MLKGGRSYSKTSYGRPPTSSRPAPLGQQIGQSGRTGVGVETVLRERRPSQAVGRRAQARPATAAARHGRAGTRLSILTTTASPPGVGPAEDAGGRIVDLEGHDPASAGELFVGVPAVRDDAGSVRHAAEGQEQGDQRPAGGPQPQGRSHVLRGTVSGSVDGCPPVPPQVSRWRTRVADATLPAPMIAHTLPLRASGYGSSADPSVPRSLASSTPRGTSWPSPRCGT